MPKQEEHEKPENLVESPHEAEQAARSLEDAADSNGTLEGYYSINETEPPEEVREQVDNEREKKKPG
ncbi:MAG: hypothetical protein ACR2IV_21435 [Bryobacteraceae bacterium]